MATWKPENVLLTLKGNEALSKVLAGQGKLTVTRIVTGAGYVPHSTLYNQKNVSDIKQTLEISRVVTDANGSEISTTLSNINLDTAYSLYQIGVYCRHTDSDEEFLYLIAQCETDKPDTIPAKTDTIANFSYNLYIQHEGTTQFEVTVNQSGVLDVSMFGKPNGVAGLDSEGILPKEVVPNASKIYLSDGVTSVEEAIANGGGAFIATYGTTTSAEIEAAYQKGKAVFCSYNNKLIPLVVRVSATNHQFYTGSLYCDALGNTKGLFLLCNNSIWSNDAEVVPYRHSSMHSIDGSDPITPVSIGAAASTHASQHASGGSDPITPVSIGAAPSGHTHDKIVVVDDRNDNVTPENTTSGITVHIKNNATDGLNNGGSLHSVVTVRSWHDMTGPKIHELGFTDNGILAHRYSTGDGTWSEWRQVALVSDIVASSMRIHEDYQTYDLNTLTEGFRVYKCNGSSSNLPVSGKFGHLMVMQASTESAYAVQVFFCELNGDGVWKRYQSGGSWTAWVRLIDSTNISSQNVNYSSYSAYAGHGSRGNPGTSCLRDISAGTSDLTAGSSALSNGNIYLVYE